MRLSEAIRLGAMIRPKARGRFLHNGASCAQGAALEAVGAACGDDVFVSHPGIPANDASAMAVG